MSKVTLPPTIPKPPSPRFLGPEMEEWKSLEIPSDSEDKEGLAKAKAAREELKNCLLASLQLQHVMVLAGSGTSLGPIVKGPSMWNLWDHCVNSNPDSGAEKRKPTKEAAEAIRAVSYVTEEGKENIELLLSRCDAFLQLNNDSEVSGFVTAAKAKILDMCNGFLDRKNEDQLGAHRTFLHRLSRRRVRDSRLKVFTTNYDLCFESAAGHQGLVVLDGFSFTQPRRFDPRFFQYDIVRRPTTGDELGAPLEGVFHLYKLHGSVNWSRESNGDVEERNNPAPDAACLIYPAKGKYQQSYIQPHLELVSQFLASLREPNTCLIVVGFGFNDDHLSEPIRAAVRTNPHLRLIVVAPSLQETVAKAQIENPYIETFYKLAMQGEDVWLLNANFSEFAELIPDLKALTPADRLVRDLKKVIE